MRVRVRRAAVIEAAAAPALRAAEEVAAHLRAAIAEAEVVAIEVAVAAVITAAVRAGRTPKSEERAKAVAGDIGLSCADRRSWCTLSAKVSGCGCGLA